MAHLKLRMFYLATAVAILSFLHNAAGQEPETRACYWPDGSVAESDSPCNATAEVSMCCAYDEAQSVLCTEAGTCIDVDGAQHVRQSCTDPTWQDPACADLCRGDAWPFGATVMHCDAAPPQSPRGGLVAGQYCCYDPSSDWCCDDQSSWVQLDPSPVPWVGYGSANETADGDENGDDGEDENGNGAEDGDEQGEGEQDEGEQGGEDEQDGQGESGQEDDANEGSENEDGDSGAGEVNEGDGGVDEGDEGNLEGNEASETGDDGGDESTEGGGDDDLL